MTVGPLHVHRWGDNGPPVLLIHGLGTNGLSELGPMAPLASEFRLQAVDRCGAGSSPDTGRHRFEEQADDIAALVEPGTHLVGTSLGGLIALLVAARVPDRLASLVLNEPAAFGIALDDPVVQSFIARFRPLADAIAAGASEAEVSAAYNAGMLHPPATEIPDPQTIRDRRAAMAEPPAWEAAVPLAPLADLAIPKLVLHGGWLHSDRASVGQAFAVVAARVAEGIGARLVEIPEADHYPFDLPRVHALLREFWLAA
jgi:pimeloyl-ACP methyl ester carboxylesterase